MVRKKMALFLPAIMVLLTCCISHKPDYIEAAPARGFNYPYYLFIPDGGSNRNELFLIVEPNNSGFVDDDFGKHLEKAGRTASKDYYIGNYAARQLQYPLLVPVFPRSRSNWKVYTHALDRDAMLEQGDLERIDLQLLKMVDDARERLAARGLQTSDQLLMTGFSASGTFVNRFTLLHPNRVKAVAAGGLNGLLALPLDSLGTRELDFPVGTGDFSALTGGDFQKAAFVNTPQFYFMGSDDDNDAIPYDDAFDAGERELIYELLGREMMPVRWKACEALYRREGVNAIIKTYGNIGHAHPDSVKQQIVEFFRRAVRPR